MTINEIDPNILHGLVMNIVARYFKVEIRSIANQVGKTIIISFENPDPRYPKSLISFYSKNPKMDKINLKGLEYTTLSLVENIFVGLMKK